ncbi:hypothetical protein ACC848_41525, partial [Rhizobium johnstonii]
LKMLAARSGTTFNAAVVEALTAYLDRMPAEPRGDQVSVLGELIAHLSARVDALGISKSEGTVTSARDRVSIDAAGVRREAERLIR